MPCLGLPLHSSTDVSSVSCSSTMWVTGVSTDSEAVCFHLSLCNSLSHCMPEHWWGMSYTYWVKCTQSAGTAELALILREKHPSRVFHNCSRSTTSSQGKKRSESHLECFHIYLLWDWERKTCLLTVTMVMAPQAFLMILHFIVITFKCTSGKNLNHDTLWGLLVSLFISITF